MRKQKCILLTTHLDSQGNKLTRSALESALPQLNRDRKIRNGLEHIRTLPPFGVIMNGEILQGEDNESYLVAESIFFDKQEYLKLDDGAELVKESFKEGVYPFVECLEQEVQKLEISTDPVNYNSYNDILEIKKIVKEESGLDFKYQTFSRKSELPDPETVITITKVLAIGLGIIKSKIPEKIGEAVAEDLTKFYKLVSKLAIETIKRAKPANRPKNYVIVYPNSECIIELVVRTNKADSVLNSLTNEKLSIIEGKVKQLKNLNPEKIQFVYNDKETWEFNYLLSKDGSVIGTLKTFNKRNMLYNQILQAQKGSE